MCWKFKSIAHSSCFWLQFWNRKAVDRKRQTTFDISPGLGKGCLVAVLEKTSAKFWKRLVPSFGKDLAMSGRGGPRHEPKPWVDVGLLYKCLEKHDGLVADLGSYEHLNSAAAPNAKALLHLKDLWVGLLEVSPTGSIHSQPLRQALVSLLAEKPDMNQGRHSGGVWANLKIERFNCLLKHVRMLGRSKTALGPAVCQLTKNEYTSLLAGLEKLQLPKEKVEEPEKKKETAKKREVEEKAKEEEVETGKSKRKLKPRDSEVSVDSKGVPQLFNSPVGKKGQASSSSGLKKPAAAGSQLASLQRPGTRLFASMGYGLEKPLPGKAKPKGVIKRPSTKKNFKPLERGHHSWQEAVMGAFVSDRCQQPSKIIHSRQCERREEAHDCASHSPPVSKLQGDSGQALGSFGKGFPD